MDHKLRPLTNPHFVCALIILLINDLYLKAEFHNWITGKLSDFAGLFVFVYFWTTIVPRCKNTVYILTGFMFVYWKSPYAQPLIDFFTESFYEIDRTIDYSDLLALLILPVAYRVNQNYWLKLESFSIPIAGLTVFSFCATSVPAPRLEFNRPEYLLFRNTGLACGEYPNECIIYPRDSLMIVGVTVIEIERFPDLHDEYHKSQILADLDLRWLRAAKGTSDKDLNSFQLLRHSLTAIGNISLVLDLDTVSDELNFKGTRLDGLFKRYSKEKKLLLEGRYKKGIQDSVWTYYDKGGKVTLRQHFAAGELTLIEKTEEGGSVSTEVSTRRDAVARQYIFLIIVSAVLIGITFRLVRNFRATEGQMGVSMSNFSKLGIITCMPSIVFVLAKLISHYILNLPADLFVALLQLALAHVILWPTDAIILYRLKLKTVYDLGSCILLFALVIVWIDVFLYLRQIMI